MNKIGQLKQKDNLLTVPYKWCILFILVGIWEQFTIIGNFLGAERNLR